MSNIRSVHLEIGKSKKKLSRSKYQGFENLCIQIYLKYIFPLFESGFFLLYRFSLIP